MKKTLKIVLSLCFGVFMFFGLMPFAFAQNVQAVSSGKTFSSEIYAKLPNTISQIPKTFEAVIKLDPSITGRGGVIIGNYKDASTPSISFEIHENGVPRLYWNNGTTTGDLKFTSVDIRNNSAVHVAITLSDNTLTCYLNGIEKMTQSFSCPNYSLSNPLSIGGDLRADNSQYFKGEILQVAAFSDVRDAKEIASDYNALPLNDSNMLFGYNLDSTSTSFLDLSGNGNTLKIVKDSKYLDESEINIPKDYAYSFMVIGDTQKITINNPSKLHYIYDYVVENAKSMNVAHVFGLGDITDTDATSEWNVAVPQITRMDGIVPYSVVRGNHDIYSAGKNMKVTSNFDRYFGETNSTYRSQYTYCFEGEGEDFRARNTIHFFKAGRFDYMVVALDYGASDNVLNWASEIIKEHPYHNVIVTTHCYLEADGSTYDKGEGSVPSRDYNNYNSYGVNDGSDMWDKFVSKHKNIVMVLCGHDPSAQIVLNQRKGVNGNIVSEVLVDPQGLDTKNDPQGLVANFYVSENGEEITVAWYSTIRQKYYLASNNFTFKVNVISNNKISFDSNGGTGAMETVEGIGNMYKLPKCEFTAPDNLEFYGWATSPSGNVITSSSISVNGDITLYAIWGEKTSKIIFDTNGGSYVESIKLPIGATISPPENPTKNGYRFVGWDKEIPTIMPNEDITITAIWESLNPLYSVTVSNGIFSPSGNQQAGTRITITANEVSSNKVFKHWQGLDGITIIEGDVNSSTIVIEMPDKDINIVGVFENVVNNTSSGCGKPANDSGAVAVIGGGIAFTFITKKKKKK